MGTIRHATLTSELAGNKVGASEWDAAHDIDLSISDITGPKSWAGTGSCKA